MLQKEQNFKQIRNYLLINDNNIRIIDKQEITFINKISIKYQKENKNMSTELEQKK